MINDADDAAASATASCEGAGDHWDGGVLVLRDVFAPDAATATAVMATIGDEMLQTFATAPRAAVDGGILLAPTTAAAPVLTQTRLLVTNNAPLRRRMQRLLPPTPGGSGGGGENFRYMLSVGDAFIAPLGDGSLLTSDGAPRRAAPSGAVWMSWSNCRCNPPLPSQHLRGVAAHLCIGHVVYVYAGPNGGSCGPGAVFRWIPNAANAVPIDDIVSQAPTGFVRHAPRATALATTRAVVLRPGDAVVVARNVVHNLPMVQMHAAAAVAATAAAGTGSSAAAAAVTTENLQQGGAYVAMYACAPLCAVNATTVGAIVAADMMALLCMPRQSVYDHFFDVGYDLARYHRGYAALFVDAADSATRPLAAGDGEPPKVCAACALR